MRTFTKREKVMLLFLVALILAAAYYFAFFQPVQNRIADAQVRIETADNDLIVEQARAVKYAQMKREIEEMKAAGKEQNSEIPDYDNLRNVMMQLDSILTMSTSYEISFSNVIVGDRTITRPVQINFTAVNYDRAKEIIQALSDCRYRCTVDGAEMAEAEGNDMAADLRTRPVQVSMVVSFYERNTMPKPAAPADGIEAAPAT